MSHTTAMVKLLAHKYIAYANYGYIHNVPSCHIRFAIRLEVK